MHDDDIDKPAFRPQYSYPQYIFFCTCLRSRSRRTPEWNDEIQDVAVHLFGHYILFAKYSTVGITHMAPHPSHCYCYDSMSIKGLWGPGYFFCNPISWDRLRRHVITANGMTFKLSDYYSGYSVVVLLAIVSESPPEDKYIDWEFFWVLVASC